MAKEIAISKRAKISEAQQYMILSVLGASIFLGIAISLVSHFAQQITFNAKVISAEDESIANFSNVIKNTGVCKAPSGSVYSSAELDNCDPNSIEVSEIPGTLRSEIIENLAANAALNSVPKQNNPNCTDEQGRTLTYKELMANYEAARGADQLQAATARIKTCSALRVIPDALPAFQNEEALLASLNKLYLIADWEPESISPSGTSESSGEESGEASEGEEVKSSNLPNEIAINSTIEADIGTAKNALSNIERSIREFNFESAHFEWESDSSISISFQATAYYINKSTVNKTTKTITPEGQ